ncbi:MAG TPA: trypsin-like peptidase domain-containing protein, partial [Candidatus Methylomirabilis sp.]|nr:trypsin-like peptidase domain-containing protein [Candidatus Methylomirabilis sp.]
TNGHVVQPYYEADDREARETLVRQAVEQACLGPGLSQERRQKAAQQMYSRVASTARVELKKTLTVILSNREKFVGEVKVYSPPLTPQPGKRVPSGLGQVTESGKDVAVVKIDAKNLPTIPLGDSDSVQVGQPVHILGFPGVVMEHDLLDSRSAFEASVTSGNVSSLKRDARGAPVIQTDAAASWGNSGGPAIDEQGEVVGMLTFISLTPDETQAIQGFNFLVPVNIVKEFARRAGAELNIASPFNAVWHDAVARYTRGDWAGALSRLDAASRLVPNLPDVRRLQIDAQLRLLQSAPASPWSSPLLLGGIATAILTLSGTTWWMLRRRRHPVCSTVESRQFGPEPEILPLDTAPAPLRLQASDLARAMAQRMDLVIIDVRTPSSYAASSVQAKGSLRASPADILQLCTALARNQGIILYCDSPGEVESVRAAQALMESGYTRAAVLAGGFASWEAASLPLERTPHARAMIAAASPMRIAEVSPAATTQVRVDLPVGVKGTGPYFNARAITLGLSGLSLATLEPLSVGQRVRLTVFLKGEPLEISGQVTSVLPDPATGRPQGVEVAFDVLSEEAAATLEGFILARRTDYPGT